MGVCCIRGIGTYGSGIGLIMNIINEYEATKMAVHHYNATHAGWLLACDAPSNHAKGVKMYNALSNADKQRASQYRDYCLALYARQKANVKPRDIADGGIHRIV